jgi:hypothetical protein
MIGRLGRVVRRVIRRRPFKTDLDKLNFGCGQDKKVGYLNVDMDPDSHPDLLLRHGDVSRIPRNAFRELYANDVLEHIPRQFTLQLLLDFSEFMTSDGKLILKTSSIIHVADKLREKRTFADHHGWTICLFGNQAHAGDYHHTGFTEVTLRTYLLAAGFSPDIVELRDEWMFYVEATKHFSWAVVDRTSTDREFVKGAYQAAVCRSPSEDEIKACCRHLRITDRRTILRSVYSSAEHLFKTAERYGL